MKSINLMKHDNIGGEYYGSVKEIEIRSSATYVNDNDDSLVSGFDESTVLGDRMILLLNIIFFVDTNKQNGRGGSLKFHSVT